MFIKKLGTVLLLLLLFSTAFAEEFTYLIHAHSTSGEVLKGAAFTDSNRLEVDGYVMLGHGSRARFAGIWTRSGKIEAVDGYGNMYVFIVIRELSKWQAINLAENL